MCCDIVFCPRTKVEKLCISEYALLLHFLYICLNCTVTIVAFWELLQVRTFNYRPMFWFKGPISICADHNPGFLFTSMFNVYILARKSVPEVEEEDLDETEKQFKIQSLPSHLQLLHALLQVRYSSVIKSACLLHALHISLYCLTRPIRDYIEVQQNVSSK